MKNITILFQGDSITDAGRRNTPDGLTGYVSFAAKTIAEENPQYAFTFVNRGVSGNRSRGLLKRYKKDFLSVAPDIVTIMIGINDVWRFYDMLWYTSPKRYAANLTKLLTKLKSDVGAKIIVMSPYLLPNKNNPRMRKMTEHFIAVCKAVATRYADAYVDVDVPMNEAARLYPIEEISTDGVHPQERGQKVIASLLSESIKSLLQ